MTSRDFCYWLQGYFEVSGNAELTKEQSAVVRNHLDMVFAHEIDPSHGGKEMQEKLSKLHERVEAVEKRPVASPDAFGPKMRC